MIVPMNNNFQIEGKQYGIDNIKAMLAFVFTAVAKGLHIDTNHDGKLSFGEIFSVITTLTFRFPELQNAFPFLRKEFKNLDDSEIEQLRDYITSELDLPIQYDDIEIAVRKTVNMLHYNYRYVRDMVELFDDPIPPIQI